MTEHVFLDASGEVCSRCRWCQHAKEQSRFCPVGNEMRSEIINFARENGLPWKGRLIKRARARRGVSPMILAVFNLLGYAGVKKLPALVKRGQTAGV